jgi:hypothetical protein
MYISLAMLAVAGFIETILVLPHTQLIARFAIVTAVWVASAALTVYGWGWVGVIG